MKLTRKAEKKMEVKELSQLLKTNPELFKCPECGRTCYINPQGKVKCKCSMNWASRDVYLRLYQR